jgi:hypothetical protein
MSRPGFIELINELQALQQLMQLQKLYNDTFIMLNFITPLFLKPEVRQPNHFYLETASSSLGIIETTFVQWTSGKPNPQQSKYFPSEDVNSIRSFGFESTNSAIEFTRHIAEISFKIALIDTTFKEDSHLFLKNGSNIA